MTSLWHQAKAESERDLAAQYVLREGCWIVRRGPSFPEVPARIWRVDHEPGNPCNKLDRWPPYIWMAEIAGEPADPLDIALYREARGITEGHYKFLCADMAWSREWQPNDPRLRPKRMADLTKLPPIGPK